ncbi:MAG: recombinase RecA [Planctomycetes bacterium]|nr:recombinase RecA [Planctomycetota bacterium]
MNAEQETKRQQSLERTLQQIEKSYGKGAIMHLDRMPPVLDGISTGSLALDFALGGTGLPRGRIIEMYGPESSGKTTLALHVIASAQKLGGVCAVVDAEHALDSTWVKKCGISLENLLVSQPDSGEEALEITEMLIRSASVDVIVIDSVAALIPKAEIEGSMGDTHVALQARLMSQALRKLTAAISKTSTILIFINQIRMKIGVMFGSPETTPGGRALKFYSSVRLDIRRIGSIKDGDVFTGNHVRVKVVKNKVAAPFREAEFDIMFSGGISKEGDLLDLAIKDEVIDKSGAWFSYKDVRLGQGRENVKTFLRDNNDLFEEIRAAVVALRVSKEEETSAKNESIQDPAAASPTAKKQAARKPSSTSLKGSNTDSRRVATAKGGKGTAKLKAS